MARIITAPPAQIITKEYLRVSGSIDKLQTASILNPVESAITSVPLAFLKFAAIGTTAAIGIVAALTKTKDEATGKVTRSGWTLVSFMIAAGAIAALTQKLELSILNEQQRAEQRYRLQEYEALYDLAHPLGELRVHINATYPMSMSPGTIGDVWLTRVRNALPPSKEYALINDPDDVLRPRGDVNSERAVFELLVDPEFDIGINRSPARAFHNELFFRTIEPRASRIYVHLDRGTVDSQIEATTLRVTDDRTIRSWRDLYDAEVTLYVPGFAPPGTKFTRFSMTFMTGAQFGQSIEVPLTEIRRRPGDYRVGYVVKLTEEELGPEPQLLP